jgi:hypothetical protein
MACILAGTLLIDGKIRQGAALFWFRLRDVGILQLLYSTHETFSKEQLLTLPHFWRPV